MKVKELIEKLQQQDPERLVMYEIEDEYYEIESLECIEVCRLWDNDDELIPVIILK